MLPRFLVAVTLLALGLYAAPAQADPISFDLGNCVSGDCTSFNSSGGGSILANIDVINGTDLLITLTNALNATALNDDPYLTNLGFEYAGHLTGLTFSSFTVLSGVVATPTFTFDTSIRSFFIDFGFLFSDAGRTNTRNQRFQAMDPNEVVRIVVGTTSNVTLSDFQLGIAKVAGTGTDGRGDGAVLTGGPGADGAIPEPSSLLLFGIGLAGLGFRRGMRAVNQR